MKKHYRILITVSELVHSSQVRNLYDLISLLDKDRFRIEVGALATGNEAQSDIESLGVKVFRLRLQPTRGFTFAKFVDLMKGPFIIAWKQYDLVHSLLYQSFFSEPFLFKFFTRTKYIYTKSNLEWENHPRNWHYKSLFADRIISISKATDDLLDQKGFGRKKAKIFLGIDTEYFVRSETQRTLVRDREKTPHDSIVFGCAAQFVEWKEHITVLRSFELLAEKNERLFLWYCGPNHRDAYYEQFLSAVNSSRFANRIRLLGSLRDMPLFYSAIDCFVLPSRYETFGYVYIEAMSSCLPVIACRAAGPLEIIAENETGLFTNMSDVADLARQMAYYADDVELRMAHGRAARQRAIELFSKETMARETSNLYMELLTKR